VKHKTSIEWTHQRGYQGAVWNPTTGCTRVSAGCDNCYAFEAHDKRYAHNLGVAKAHGETRAGLEDGGVRHDWPQLVGVKGGLMRAPQYDLPFSRVQLMEERVAAPLRVRRPTCYFVDSMADLFHEDVSFDFLDGVFNTMGRATQHRFLILTKRPERMREYVSIFYGDRDTLEDPWPNIWLGTSVEDQASADKRIPELLATPAAVRFLSCEPLLGPVVLKPQLVPGGWPVPPEPRGIQWVIVGGESGSRARPMDLAWARSLRDQCAAAGVSFFMKQMGSKPSDHDGYAGLIALHEAHGRDMAEWPEDLRVREWPRAGSASSIHSPALEGSPRG
jgi:protein gp37